MISRRLPIPNPSHDRGAGGFLFCAACPPKKIYAIDFWLDWMAFRRGKRVVERERTIEEKAALFDLMQAAG